MAFDNLPLFAASFETLWYVASLITAISLVYSASRHEDKRLILTGAARTAAWIAGFMLVVFGILMLISWRL